MKEINIVLVGFNGYGKFYVNLLFDNPYHLTYHFRAVVDPFLSEEDKEVLTEKNILFFNTLEEFYTCDKADLIIIAAPIHFHKSFCETAVKNGSTVLCEKPATARLCDLYEMREYEKKYKKDIFIGFQFAFADPILALKKDLISGIFGDIISCKSIVLWPRDLAYYNRTTGWAGKIKTKDGMYVYDSVASNATAHYLHNLLFLLGDKMGTSVALKEMTIKCKRAHSIESFDSCIIRAETFNEQEILFIASHVAEHRVDPIFEIKCDKAIIQCDFSKENGELSARWHNGASKNYGEVNTLPERHKKLIHVVQWLNDPSTVEKPLSTIMSTRTFTQVIDSIFEQAEFESFEQGIVFDQVKNRLYVENLYEELINTYQNSE